MTIEFSAEQLRAYFVCGSQDVGNRGLVEILEAGLRAGITAFQFRDKGISRLTATERLQLGQQLHRLCATYQVPFIVDDDVELALALKADGIHVGQRDQQIRQVLAQVAGKMFVGLSCSTPAEVLAANQLSGLAYLGSGPVFPTTSKADADPVIGLPGLTNLVQLAQTPIVAIGGITESQLGKIAETGASGAAVISLLTQSPDMTATVQKMLQAWV
ncbi:thiamine phosphate synthase [Lactiplantibacillus sp. WILCCON 0030]|uniref:Thiamine-phosphate synthase n=1 Tax=Lactiplantibacillus brownii TaxID=3069269 RepID=A0ABU1A525_9LACO|nr:thiamine phosphate synthase [Lactiplantibacillus brownii]MDQ7936102.1 thiamine phosphate synthase [Lactiplantibacillus brownii]